MSEILRRAALADMEIRQDSSGEGRTVYGLAVPYDSPARITERGVTYEEVFRLGAFADAATPDVAGRIKFLANHKRDAFPLGSAIWFEEQSVGLVGEFRVANTTDGNNALELIRSGDLDGLSIGFVPRENRGTPAEGFVERVRAKILEVSAVTYPAYDLATIGGVRSAFDDGSVRDQDNEARDQGEDERDQLVDLTLAARRRLRLQLLARKAQP